MPELRPIKSDSGDDPSQTTQKGIYLLPNLLTTAALFAGFYAIVAAMKGLFEDASIAIFIAMIADGLDGRVARLTNTQSAFGAQYDSLSDMAAFGIAPALVIYSWCLSEMGKVGWLVAFLHAAATALRLARFNSQVTDKAYFQGLPSPAAAGVLAGGVWAFSGLGIDGGLLALPVMLTTLFVATMMVSSVRYYSFKDIDFKGRVPFVMVVTMVFLITAIALEPAEMLMGLFSIYAISGPVATLWKVRKARKHRKSSDERSNSN